MIYGLFIFDRAGKILLQRFYGKTNLNQELLTHFVKEFILFIQNFDRSDRVECLNLENMKLVYYMIKDTISAIATDQKEEEMYLTGKLIKVHEQFTKIYENLSKEEVKEHDLKKNTPKIEENTLKNFEKTVDEILFPFLKIAILGSSGVGKTSIMKLIIGEKPDPTYTPTIGVDIKEFDLDIKNMKLIFWDFSGQPHFRKLWQPFLEGTDIVILVTDSQTANLAETRAILQLVRTEKPDANILLIANKQDLPDANPPEKIEKYMGIRTYGIVAIDTKYREKVVETLKEIIAGRVESNPQPPDITT
ncbi:MAG: GTP-binding protein [Candidatus Freyarchaeota archaeon]|nr:GTP-binding protein [Candidatus Jordarchaeia archaeon]MBS7270088.1 GTP-binding protein [Candidatus Jordarchaeia archaeon]MBS7280764.1 GTP-binding protein [Candidatus Jordarchaeia archaeon]